MLAIVAACELGELRADGCGNVRVKLDCSVPIHEEQCRGAPPLCRLLGQLGSRVGSNLS